MTLAEVKSQVGSMRSIRVEKVVLNVGVGKSGEVLERAKHMLQDLTDQTPSARNSKRTIREFGIRQGEPIGVMVTLRGSKGLEVLRRILTAREMKAHSSSFDEHGNFSFGVREHIEIPGVRYNPEIGIFGLNVAVVLARPGYRIARRRRAPSKIGRKHWVTREEAVNFFKQQLAVEVV